TDLVLRMLHHAEKKIQQVALGIIDKRSMRIPTDEFIPFLSGGDWIRTLTCRILSKQSDPAVIALLVPLLSDGTWSVRTAAAEALTELGEPGEHVTADEMLAAFHRCDVRQTAWAVNVLGALGAQ